MKAALLNKSVNYALKKGMSLEYAMRTLKDLVEAAENMLAEGLGGDFWVETLADHFRLFGMASPVLSRKVASALLGVSK